MILRRTGFAHFHRRQFDLRGLELFFSQFFQNFESGLRIGIQNEVTFFSRHPGKIQQGDPERGRFEILIRRFPVPRKSIGKIFFHSPAGFEAASIIELRFGDPFFRGFLVPIRGKRIIRGTVFPVEIFIAEVESRFRIACGGFFAQAIFPSGLITVENHGSAKQDQYRTFIYAEYRLSHNTAF